MKILFSTTPTSVLPGRRLGQPRMAVALLFVGVIIGYPMAGLVASAMDWDSTVSSIPIRVLILILSAWLWLTAGRPGGNRGGLWLGLFGGAYLVRLLWDIGVAQLPGAVEALLFFLATVVIPAASIWRAGSSLDETQTMRLLFILGSAICIFALGLHALGIGQDRSLTEVTGRLSFEALNPISIGHTAVSTLIAALCIARHGLRPGQATLLLAGGLAAGATLLLAASRGPLICLTAAGVFYALATGRWFWVALITLALTPFLFAADSQLLMRFRNLELDESALERLTLQSNAIDQFLSNPILGSAFVDLQLLTYPHNLFLETAMAMGVLGLLLLLIILWKTAKAVRSKVGSGQLLVVLLFIQYFIGAQLSGAIYGNSSLVVCLVLLLRAPSQRMISLGRRHASMPNRSISKGIA